MAITTPDLRTLLGPLLPALPAAALSRHPAPALLPLLSPILRQRVQLFSESSTEPWLRLLTYDSSKTSRLAEVARSDRLEPHPVSGEVEVDWEYDVQTRYRRLDEETLECMAVMQEFDLGFRLLWCVGDQEGGGDGWRVAEVSVPEKGAPFGAFEGGQSTIEEAERVFREKRVVNGHGKSVPVFDTRQNAVEEDAEDDDDDYWNRYDATPARTPAAKRSPAPQMPTHQQSYLTAQNHDRQKEEEDAYFSQYGSVQPAMDNHDPDEVPHIEVAQSAPLHSALQPGTSVINPNPQAEPSPLRPRSSSAHSRPKHEQTANLAHPRPASSASSSSNATRTVENLEEQAGKQGQGEFGVRQHVSRSIRSLFLLSRAAGMDREAFEGLVRGELDVLGMIEDEL